MSNWGQDGYNCPEMQRVVLQKVQLVIQVMARHTL